MLTQKWFILLKYEFFTLLKFPPNSLPFNFWCLMFPWLNRKRQEPQAWIPFYSVLLFPGVFPYVWLQGEATLSHEEAQSFALLGLYLIFLCKLHPLLYLCPQQLTTCTTWRELSMSYYWTKLIWFLKIESYTSKDDGRLQARV